MEPILFTRHFDAKNGNFWVVLKAGMPEIRNGGMAECRNTGNQDPEILKPGKTSREGKRAK